MKFKVGDKVKFLNEKGGGVVSKIVSMSLVYVATADGFELPTATGDIIKINPESRAEKMFSEDFDVKIPDSSGDGRTDHEEDTARAGKIRSGAEETPGFYLAFAPEDQQWFITGNLEVCIINHTKYDILYNLLLQDEDENYFGFDYGSVEAGTSTGIDNIEREALSGWANGMVQILIHSEEDSWLPLHSTFHIKAGKFVSEGSYHESGLLREKAIIYKLAELKSCRKIPGKKQAVQVEEKPVELKATEHKKETLIGKYATGPHTAVVDLHIGEIVDNIAGLNSYDMLQLQLEYFIKTLESALANNFRKVTFIHGIGNGVLKNGIIKKLEEYEGVENRSASLAEYGQGAVDVLLHYQ